MKLLFPILIILISVVAFYSFINPILNDPLTHPAGVATGGIKALTEHEKVLKASLQDADDLRAKISELTNRMNAIPQSDLNRLDNFLPDSVNEVQLVTDIDNIAKRSAMTIDQVNLQVSQAPSSVRQSSLGVRPAEIANLNVTFQATGTYSQLRSFMSDVAQSLRILDISDISFTVDQQDSGRHDYNITLTTYWVRI